MLFEDIENNQGNQNLRDKISGKCFKEIEKIN